MTSILSTYFEVQDFFDIVNILIESLHGSNDVKLNGAEPACEVLWVEVVEHPIHALVPGTVQDVLDELRRRGDGTGIGRTASNTTNAQ